MNKIETAAQRDQKIKELSRRVTALCAAFYDRATDEQKAALWKMLDSLEDALVSYREHETPWDSKLIDVVIKVGDVRCNTKEFSTWDSVMDKARELYAFVASN